MICGRSSLKLCEYMELVRDLSYVLRQNRLLSRRDERDDLREVFPLSEGYERMPLEEKLTFHFRFTF